MLLLLLLLFLNVNRDGSMDTKLNTVTDILSVIVYTNIISRCTGYITSNEFMAFVIMVVACINLCYVRKYPQVVEYTRRSVTGLVQCTMYLLAITSFLPEPRHILNLAFYHY